jgi:hypothetical protein
VISLLTRGKQWHNVSIWNRESDMAGKNPSILCFVACVLASGSGAVLAAGQTVPGERWQHKMSMQMGGMNMAMPGTEVCAPVGQAAQELAKPDKNCTVSNAKQSGNRFTADVKCTGKDAMEGTIDMTTGPDHMTGKMTVRSAAGEMTMVTDSRKLGACQAIDTGAMVAKAEAQAQQGRQIAAQAEAQMCASDSFKLKGDPGKVGNAALLFLDAKGPCAGKPLPAEFCAAVQSRAGFASLGQMETAQPGTLGRSLEACKLGSGKAAVDALRGKLLASAEADGDGGYLIANAPARARQLAKSECVLKGEMWAGRQSKWDSFCDSNFATEARGGR